MAYVWDHSPLTRDALLVHLAIADVANDVHNNEFWMTAAGLAEKVRVSRSTVMRAFARMTELGLLEIVERGGGRGKPTTYRLLFPKLSQDDTDWATSEPGETVSSTQETVSSRSETVSSGEIAPLYRTQETQGTQLAPAARKTDELWEAMLSACHIDSAITNGARAGYNKALKELRDAGATPEELCARARNHRTMWPQASLTPHSLAKHWAELRTLPRAEDPAMAAIRAQRELEGRA